jgi:phospholipase C
MQDLGRALQGAVVGFKVEPLSFRGAFILPTLSPQCGRALRARARLAANATSSPTRKAIGVIKEKTMSKVMPQIHNVVHLMLENRSLDNLLGWLYANAAPKHVYPTSNTAPYDGLVKGRYSNPFDSLSGVKNYPVVPIPSNQQGQRVPAYDPYEAMVEGSDWNGVMNQLFGNQTMIDGMPHTGNKAQMLGFLQDYYARYMVTWQGLDILWSYTPQQAPNINALAAAYAVSDRWFSSVPTQTNPNRAYSICGTSLGREANANLQAVEQFNAPTLFNALANAGKAWGMYYEDIWQQKQCYTQYTFPQIASALPNGEIETMQTFFAHARNGTLPAFTYLEPKWGYGKGSVFVQGDDYHPPTLIGPGDDFLMSVYSALRNSPQWGNLLFVVTFDEHGGTYDHVAPPWGAINPDGINGTKWGFNFQQYGARVPTLLISPFIAPGTVFREPAGSAQPYDHTSFIKTMLLWAGVDPTKAGLGKRVIAAPSFDGVLSPTPVNSLNAAEEKIAFAAIVEPEIDAPQTAPDALALESALFADIPFASVREIVNNSKTLDDVHAWIAKYNANPEAFEAALAVGVTPG